MIHVKNFEKLGRKKRKRKSLNIIPSLIEIGGKIKMCSTVYLCSRALVRWGMGSLAPPECWASKKKTERERGNLLLSVPVDLKTKRRLCVVC